jgi:para-aminobenzoate synthetase/4-amino-4-deoxychorismate lyase
MAYLPESGLRHRARHLERLAQSASYFGYSFDGAAINMQLDLATQGAGPSMVRLGLRRDGTAEITCQPLPPRADQLVTLAVDPEPVDSTQPWPYHKTSRRDPYTIRRERHPYADDVLLVNERGEVTESTIANLAVRLSGRWWTPPLSAGCLPGVERQRLVEDGTLTERVIWVTDLARAESLALVSSVRGWRPATFVETHR